MTPLVIDVSERGGTVTWAQGFVSKLVSHIEVVGKLVSRQINAPRPQRFTALLSVGDTATPLTS